MAFTPVNCRNGYDYLCKSGDTKQTDGIAVNAVCWEWNTNKFFVFDDSDDDWHPVGEDAE